MGPFIVASKSLQVRMATQMPGLEVASLLHGIASHETLTKLRRS